MNASVPVDRQMLILKCIRCFGCIGAFWIWDELLSCVLLKRTVWKVLKKCTLIGKCELAIANVRLSFSVNVLSYALWQIMWHSNFHTDFWKKEPLTSRFREVIIRSSAWSVCWPKPLLKAKHIRIFSLSHPPTQITKSVKITASNTSCEQNI